MTIKELQKLLKKIITKHPECSELPVRVFQDNDCGECISSNHWLTHCNLHSTGDSGYEECGELTLIGSE